MNFNKETFLNHKQQFDLGTLTTESQNQKTLNLSNLVKDDLPKAVKLLQNVDHDALNVLLKKENFIFKLQKQCQKILKTEGKIFIVGCGATGRLALSIEKIFRSMRGGDQVVSFMAGGDYALIKSIERFEDSFEYGRKQLHELGYNPEKDILLAITEGGETSFVIGALEEASRLSASPCWFLYCNPDEELLPVERSARVINNPKIEKLNLTVGPMAITGSTRMQATTVQMIAAGVSILYDWKDETKFSDRFKTHIERLKKISLDFIPELIEFEYGTYQNNQLMTYSSDSSLAIAILTDTTERSPTFNMNGFEKIGEAQKSLVYLCVEDTTDQKTAWSQLLGRRPRCLNWKEFDGQINERELMKFDISSHSIERRAGQSLIFKDHKDSIEISSIETTYSIPVEDWELFWRHMLLKLVLNIHSTLLMGKLGRFEGNLMTYVRPSNFKLVNRASRYIRYFLDKEGLEVEDEKIINLIFEHQQGPETQAPVVISVLNKLGVFL